MNISKRWRIFGLARNTIMGGMVTLLGLSIANLPAQTNTGGFQTDTSGPTTSQPAASPLSLAEKQMDTVVLSKMHRSGLWSRCRARRPWTNNRGYGDSPGVVVLLRAALWVNCGAPPDAGIGLWRIDLARQHPRYLAGYQSHHAGPSCHFSSVVVWPAHDVWRRAQPGLAFWSRVCRKRCLSFYAGRPSCITSFCRGLLRGAERTNVVFIPISAEGRLIQ